MPTITVKESAAAEAVGTNLMSGNRIQMASTFRRVRKCKCLQDIKAFINQNEV